jgi:uroporphyrinogen decarboxylase
MNSALKGEDMIELSSLDRIKLALEHKEPDKVPFDLGSTVVTGINRKAYINLRKYLGLPEKEVVIEDIFQQLAVVDDDVKEILKIDVYGVNPGSPRGYQPRIDTAGDYSRYIDEWGIEWHMPLNGGLYYDMRKHPLADIDTVEKLKLHKFPDPLDEGRFDGIAEKAAFLINEKQKAYVLGRNAPGIFELALWTRGFENYYCDMLLNEALSEDLLDRIMEFKLAYWDKVLDIVGDNVLVISEADDLCAQNDLLISKELYRQYLKPRHTKLFEFIKKKAAVKVYIFYHCCGAASEVLGDLIESGIDILNPVQVSAKGMDSRILKQEFGKDVTFWGGGVDTQFILPKGNTQQVKEEVKRRIGDFAPGGGFVFNAVHNIQGDVPPQNIVAMWEALQTYGVY